MRLWCSTLNDSNEKCIGLDVGEVRVGVSVSNPERTLAVPVGVFERAKGAAERQIIELVERDGVQTLVVGLPLSDDGQENEQCEKVRRFCRRIERRCSVSIEFIDEYLTSVEARQRLKQTGKKETVARKKGIIDAVAATILLQAYLDQGAPQEKRANSTAGAEE
jgi:putative Holliday junction resolvase